MAGPPGNKAAERTALLAARNMLAAQGSSRVSNRSQKWLFVLATLLITVAVAVAARKLAQPKTVVFAVAAPREAEMQFANKLAALVEQNTRLYRIKVQPMDGKGAVLSAFAQGKANLAILRTDSRAPADARAIAVLEHDLLLILAPKGSKLKSLSAIKNRKVVVVGNDARDDALVRDLLGVYDLPGLANLEDQSFDQLPKLLDPGSQSVAFVVIPKSQLAQGKVFEALARKPGFELIEIDGNKAVERRLKGVSAETVDEGLVSALPRLPADDLNSIGVEELLVIHSAANNSIAAELVRLVLENKDQLAVDDRFATAIEPPDVDKDAQILAHPGTIDYVNGDVKSFLDQYSDLIYISMSVASIVGSIFLGLYSTVTKVSPVRAGLLTDAMFEIAEEIREAPTIAAVEQGEANIEGLLKDMVGGMRDGWISNDGFEIFRLAHDAARDAVVTRRQVLSDHPPQLSVVPKA